MPLRSALEVKHAIISTAAGGTIPVVSAVAAQRVTVNRVLLVAGGATNITFQDTAGGAISTPFILVANGSIVLDISINGDPWFITGAGLGLQLNSSAAVQVNADIYYLQGP